MKHFNVKPCFLITWIFWLSNPFQSFGGDTIHVVTHQKETVVTDPSTGFKVYRNWGVFPDKKTSIRQIILHVKFGCPDSMRCADWDYLDAISIKRLGGVNAGDKNFEIARILTPYGGAFTKDWKFDWQLDVTDFGLLLRDSVEIEYYHSGYEPNHDRGWQVTLDFELIKGIPVAEPVSIQKIYGGNFKYGDSITSIEANLPPVIFEKEKNADFAKLKISQTGHGANEKDGCGEFCSKMRDIIFNDQKIDSRPMWKKCGDNALYPQAGTWIFDRANWCPGYLFIPDEYILPIKNKNVIDVNMEPYVATNTQAVENILAYIVQYKKVKAPDDATILEIINPTDKKIHLRKNPICANASIIIKNSGSNMLKNLEIEYGTAGFKTKKYFWTGKLNFNETDTISLPGAIDAANLGENIFNIKLSKPNGKSDGFASDNQMMARFKKAPVHSGDVVIVFKTNSQPEHNTYHIMDSDGKVVFERAFDTIQKNKIFRDTLHLSSGCYSFIVKDSVGDGLEFWFNNRAGRGYVMLQDSKGNLLKQFDSDFGSTIQYAFSVNDNRQEWSAVNVDPYISLYPTRTNGSTTLDYYHGKEEDVTVQIITDDGAKLVEEHQYKGIKSGTFTYDLSYMPARRYYLKVFINGNIKYNKRIRVEKRN
jgi:hypothetical protein